MINTILQGDCLEVLKTLESESVDCVITSPPYWALRDYGVDKQLGLEPTFQEYINRLCDVFDEVKRVLKKSGTCWVNMGDTYGGSGKGAGGYSDKSTLQGYTGEHTKGRQMAKESWNFKKKPKIKGDVSKSLIQIPSRFAIEMTNRRGFKIKNPDDRAWLAGIIEGEGCITIHKREGGRKNATYGIVLSVANTSRVMIDRIAELTGLGGNIQEAIRGRNQKLYRWNAMSDNAKWVLREIYPHIVSKRNQARCALWSPSSGKEAEECWQNLKKMHHYEKTTRDYPEPEVGGIDPWILRNEIIWKKPNCMPSSVRDRFTVDFEKVFFFVKNKKYWFEQQFEQYEAWENRPSGIVRNRIFEYDSKINNNPQAYSPRQKAMQSFYGENRGNLGKGINGSTLGTKDSLSENGRNKRCVWKIPTKPFKEAHFATFPEKLVEPMIKAGCPEKKGFESGIVLDPFIGAGTTAVVAKKLNRNWLGIELNPEYIKIANKRISEIPDRLL